MIEKILEPWVIEPTPRRLKEWIIIPNPCPIYTKGEDNKAVGDARRLPFVEYNPGEPKIKLEPYDDAPHPTQKCYTPRSPPFLLYPKPGGQYDIEKFGGGGGIGDEGGEPNFFGQLLKVHYQNILVVEVEYI